MVMVISKRDSKGRIKKGNNLKHGLSDHPVYDCWIAMRARCEKPHHPSYKHYGGRGIKVEWQSFEDFYGDVGKDWKSGLTLDRIDNNGNYSTGNCRWVTIQEQQKNTRGNSENVGIRYESDRKKWRADLTRYGKRYFLGRFKNKEDALMARKLAEEKYV